MVEADGVFSPVKNTFGKIEAGLRNGGGRFPQFVSLKAVNSLNFLHRKNQAIAENADHRRKIASDGRVSARCGAYPPQCAISPHTRSERIRHTPRTMDASSGREPLARGVLDTQ